MSAHGRLPNLVEGAFGNLREGVPLSEDEYEIVSESQDELVDPKGWHRVLETFAGTMGVAVALTDPKGRLLGVCHNPQPAWKAGRREHDGTGIGCTFCLVSPVGCRAVSEALRTGVVTIAEDLMGLSHVAVPLSLGGKQLGALIAGQAFCSFPEPLRIERAARQLRIAKNQVWQQCVLQTPVTKSALKRCGNLLMQLGQAILGQHYARILHKKLDQTGQRYRMFIEGVRGYALYTVDSEGFITSWNRGAERIFGYQENEIIGRDSACLLIPGESHGEALVSAVVQADRSGWADLEGWRIRKDGSRLYVAGVLASMGQGASREYGGLIRDITEVRRKENDVQQAQKLEAIGVLAGGIAHDFNNLLGGIIGGLSVIKTSLAPDAPAYSMCELAEESGLRAAELVAQLLAYAGKGRSIVTRFDFCELISDMLPLIGSSIQKKVELVRLLKPGLPWIEADASQIRQIVMNLVINGAESIGPEGGTVRVLCDVSGDGADVFLEVTDSGSGMSETTKSKIFDPFFTTKFAGRGLGLAAVLGIVRSHKGSMDVVSAPGLGSTFIVRFPAVEVGVKPVAPLATVLPPGTGTVLVVDDEPSLRKMAAVFLQRVGYTVLTAENGFEAVEMFRANAGKIDAVVLDMTMPVMGGLEAFRLIRELQPGVPIVLSSGYNEGTTREELGKEAVAGFVQKPYNSETLVSTVQLALRSCSTHRISDVCEN